jgi:hypothetical protein
MKGYGMGQETPSSTAAFSRDSFERFAARLRIVAWLWIAAAAVLAAFQSDLPGMLAIGLSGMLAMELIEVAALVLGPGTAGLALSSVIERVSYLASDLNLL